MTELHSAGDIAKNEKLTVQAVYEAMRRGEITPAIVTKGGRMLYTAEEVQRWREKRAARRNAK
jgi:hypothetical protein